MENENTVNLDAKLSAITRWEDGTYVDADILANVLEEHLKAEDRSDLAKVCTAVTCTFNAIGNPTYAEKIGFQDPKDNWKFNFVELTTDWEKEKEDFLMSEYKPDESERGTACACAPEEETQTQPEVKTNPKAEALKTEIVLKLAGACATALGTYFMSKMIPKVEEAGKKLAENVKARRAERKKLKEQKKLDVLIEAEKAKTE